MSGAEMGYGYAGSGSIMLAHLLREEGQDFQPSFPGTPCVPESEYEGGHWEENKSWSPLPPKGRIEPNIQNFIYNRNPTPHPQPQPQPQPQQ